MPPAGIQRIGGEGVDCREHFWLEEPPEAVVRKVLPHMRGGRQQQEVMTPPVQLPAWSSLPDARQGFCQPVAVGPAQAEIRFSVSGELVGFVKDDEIVRENAGLLEACKHALACQRIDADNDQVTIRFGKRVACTCVAPCDHPKREAEERAQLTFPIPEQPRRGDDEHSANEPAGEHLTDVETRHDRLAGTGIICQEEAQARLRQQVFVDGNPLMGKWINKRDLGSERWVNQMPVRQALAFCDGTHNCRITRKVDMRSPLSLALQGRFYRLPGWRLDGILS